MLRYNIDWYTNNQIYYLDIKKNINSVINKKNNNYLL